MADALFSVVFDILIQRVHQAIAVAVDHDEISNLNLHVGFDSSHRKNTALHIAARVGNKKMVEALLSEGTPASLLTENSKHENPLHIAARSGHVHVVLRMRNMEGNTPLHEAVRNGHHSTVLVLVEANDSDLLVSLNNAGESPLFMAVDVRASEIVKTILPNSNPYSLLHRSSDGQTILHRAILRADLNSCGRSPLHYAAASGALALVDHLLQLKPSNGSFLDNNLATPAHMAAENGHLNVLKLFVKRCRYWVELLNNHHQNILHVAAQNGHLKVVRYIQNMFMVNDLLNETDEDGNTPLHLAAAKLHSSIVSTLVQTGNMDTTAINKKGETVLDIARKFQLVSPSNEGNEGTDGNQAQATPNKTGCAGDEKIEAKKQRTIEILKAASAKQAKKLEGILEQEDLIIESIRDKRRKEMAGTLIVMATLVATVTFTAAFTLPGGIQSEGPHQGMAVLTRKAAFKAFIVTDTVAMTTSMTAAVILFTSSWNDEKNKWNLHFIALQLLWMSLASMGLAFLTGLFTVLSHSMELAIMVCFIGCLFPSLLYLLGPLILPEEFVWSLVDIIEKTKTKIYSFWILHNK
ncbi:Ankyrin repeat-containing protein [Vitis vinifera]|uniref:Ankyrin repeat-containing protein n=1 Tax=Vitis vinifera TaxID=29760 RepID=A0A438IS64_VITVI|nr:Ankyrin repeat-containing protein [Vitis vinifera]